MTLGCPTEERLRQERPDTVYCDQTRLYRLLSALAGPSGICTADLDEIRRLLRLRPLSLRIALLGLRVRGKIAVSHSPDRNESITVTFPAHEVAR